MALVLRFDPPIEFQRLLARPQIDQDGVVCANAFDQVEIVGQDAASTQRRERCQAPSPEEIPKTQLDAGEVARPLAPTAAPIMAGFQAINAIPAVPDANRTNAVPPPSDARCGLGPARLPSRSPTPAIRELPARDWTLASIVDKESRQGVFHYRTRWKETVLDVSYIQKREDSSWVVRCRGTDWVVEVLNDATLNENLGAFECQVKWQDTWHPIWEYSSALQSIVAWETLNDPEAEMPRKRYHWWRYPQTTLAHYDRVTEYDPASRREIVGDEIEPEAGADYTFPLLERLMMCLTGAEHCTVPTATICKLLNTPARQPLIFSDAFVAAGRTYPLIREEHIRAAAVHITGYARKDPCSSCKERSSTLPFDSCVVLGNTFHGCCTNCVAVRNRDSCDLHDDVRIFKDAGVTPVDGDGEIDGGETGDDAETISSSPLPVHGQASRSSVEPESSDTARTPPTSPSAHAGHDRGSSPELGGPDGFEPGAVGPARRLRRTKASRSSTPTPVQPDIASTYEVPSAARRSRKRKFSADDEYASGVQDVGTEDSGVDSSGVSARSHTHPPIRPKLEADDEVEAQFTHEGCPGRGRPCKHPVFGTPDPLPFDFPGLVYKDHRFQRDGEATEDQVKFVISRMNCQYAQYVQQVWEKWRTEDQGAGEHKSKYSLLAGSVVHLNGFVKDYCPEFVDLTMGD